MTIWEDKAILIFLQYQNQVSMITVLKIMNNKFCVWIRNRIEWQKQPDNTQKTLYNLKRTPNEIRKSRTENIFQATYRAGNIKK